MRASFGVRRVLLSLWVTAAVTLVPGVSRADEGRPLREVLADALTSSGAVVAERCPTGRGGSEVSPDGLVLRVSGRCLPTSTASTVNAPVRGVGLADGEIHLQVRSLESTVAPIAGVFARIDPSGRHAVWALLGETRVVLGKTVDGVATSVVERTGTGPVLNSGAWTAVSLVLRGDQVALLLNGVETASFGGAPENTGAVQLSVLRPGGDDAPGEAAAVFHNLRILEATGAGNAAPTPQSTATVLRDPAATPVPAPTVGQLVLEDDLSRDGRISPSRCPTGRGAREFEGGALQFRLSGRCQATDSAVESSTSLGGVALADGEVAVEFKVLEGERRAGVTLITRIDEAGSRAHVVLVAPDRGVVAVVRSSRDGPAQTLAQRSDLHASFRAGEWNQLTSRSRGERVWVLLNGREVLLAVDEVLAGAGGIGLGLARLGGVEGDDEVVAAFRNFRVSALAGGDQARAPVVEPWSQQPTPGRP
ncbi:MAG: hypothetical protein U0821_14530 [Chloroflexota bacterium]